MSDVIKVVKVVRKDAPGGFVEVNESDVTKDEIVYKEKPSKVADEKPSKGKG